MIKNKKAVSVMIGYVLLITFGIIMSVMIFAYLKTYVPRDSASCPDGVSLFLKDYECNSTHLNITLKNNGRFNVVGYFIKAANSSDQIIGTMDLAPNYSVQSNVLPQGAIVFNLQNLYDFMKPGVEISHLFNHTSEIALIEIMPAVIKGKNQQAEFTVCGNAIVREEIVCTNP